jgi:uncharacterized protein (DUF1778 family)
MPPPEARNNTSDHDKTSDRATSKIARLEARITPDQKALFERAAALSGRTLSEFVINSAQEIAARMVREQEVMTLGGRDRKAFVAALLKPSTPGRRLRRAARRYTKATGQ